MLQSQEQLYFDRQIYDLCREKKEYIRQSVVLILWMKMESQLENGFNIYRWFPANRTILNELLRITSTLFDIFHFKIDSAKSNEKRTFPNYIDFTWPQFHLKDHQRILHLRWCFEWLSFHSLKHKRVKDS